MFSNAFRIVVRIFFSRFSNRFSYRFKSLSGAISFCRRAALTNRTFKSRDLWFEPLFKSPLESQCQFLIKTSQSNELFWEGSHCLKSLVVWLRSRFESQIAIAVKSRDLEHLVRGRTRQRCLRLPTKICASQFEMLCFQAESNGASQCSLHGGASLKEQSLMLLHGERVRGPQDWSTIAPPSVPLPDELYDAFYQGGIKRDKLSGTNRFLRKSAVSYGFLRKSAVSCGFLRKSAVSCGFLRKSAPPKWNNSQEKRKSAKISENLRKLRSWLRWSHLVCPF